MLTNRSPRLCAMMPLFLSCCPAADTAPGLSPLNLGFGQFSVAGRDYDSENGDCDRWRVTRVCLLFDILRIHTLCWCCALPFDKMLCIMQLTADSICSGDSECTPESPVDAEGGVSALSREFRSMESDLLQVTRLITPSASSTAPLTFPPNTTHGA